MSHLKGMAKALAGAIGYDVRRRDHSHPARRAAAMALRGVDVLLDVGANEGQYVRDVRRFGYKGRVVSFEPFPGAFAALQDTLAADPDWSALNAALGPSKGTSTLGVGRSSLTSSLLATAEALRSHIAAAEVVEEIEVQVESLDDLWASLVSPDEVAMLKIDVQGYEHHVLDGADACLTRIPLIEVEMALLPLYDGGSTVHDLLPRLHDDGFEVISVAPGFVDVASGQVLDIDVLLGRAVPVPEVLPSCGTVRDPRI